MLNLMKSQEKSDNVDILIITAVKDEFDFVRKMETDWDEKNDKSGCSYFVRKYTVERGGIFIIALARPVEMGGVSAAISATRLVIELNPRCLAMVGICAGWKDAVFLGDVIVAERVFNYEEGKLIATKNKEKQRVEDFRPDYKAYNLNPHWLQKAQDFPPKKWINKIEEKRPISYNYQEEWLMYALFDFENNNKQYPKDIPERERISHCPQWESVVPRLIKKKFVIVGKKLKLTKKGNNWIVKQNNLRNDNCPKADPPEPRAHVGVMGMGSQVKEDPEIFKKLSLGQRKILAIDLESAAIARVAVFENVDFIIVKSVSDYGDNDKNDQFRKYAIESSYRFLMAFLEENLSSQQTIATQTSNEKIGEEIEALRNKYKELYREGKSSEALKLIEKAYLINPTNTLVVRSYINVMLRHRRYKDIESILEKFGTDNGYDDNIRLAKGEFLWRQKNYKQAIEVISRIKRRDSRVNYELGICYLLLASQDNLISNKLTAISHFEKAHEIKKDHWWVTMNLAIAKKISHARDIELELEAKKQIEQEISKYPLKASARLYRLLYYILNDDLNGLINAIKIEHEICPKIMEIAPDFFDTAQTRIQLLFPSSIAKQNEYLQRIQEWAVNFTILS